MKECMCAYCEISFKSSRTKNYCSKLCKNIRAGQTAPQCAVVRECLTCGNRFTPSNRNWNANYCKRHCSHVSDKERKRVRLRRRAIGVKPKPESKPKFTVLFYKECDRCNKNFYARFPFEKKCSVCKIKTKRTAAETRECSCCGVMFSPLKVSHFCSNDCRRTNKRESTRKARNIAKRVRRAKIKGVNSEPVNRLRVFERDNWQCQACGDETPETLIGTTDDNAPELDHVQPLSRGGEHTYENTQCLCRLCNIIKSDMDMGRYIKEWCGRGEPNPCVL